MIKIDTITKSFGDFKALDSINHAIDEGKLVALLGPSGCGKTTLLRIIAGLEHPDSGRVLMNDIDISKKSPKDRGIGFVFQHYALFNHMSVFENVAFGLRVKPKKVRPDDEYIKSKVKELLKLVQLDWLSDAYPTQLSGGQRQRVALARSLAIEPKVLLLDEPFSALDATVRRELRKWIRQLHDELHITSIFVTHDQEEAMEIADTVIIMNKGKIIQSGTPDNVYDHPANSFVYNFLGDVNRFSGQLHSGNFTPENKSDLHYVQKGSFDVVGMIRPHDIEISLESNDAFSYKSHIINYRSSGPVIKMQVQGEIDMKIIDVEITKSRFRKLNLDEGTIVYLNLQEIRVFTDEGAGI
jgi:sulfate transport system ATP-binding protein